MNIYQFFPRLAADVSEWSAHADRAAAMGFDVWYVNPLARRGASDSLYSIADARSVDPLWAGRRSGDPAEAERRLRAALADVRARGLRVMIDLVLNHTAADAPLVREHPEWYLWENGAPAHPGCVEENGSRTVWHDLARLDWTGTRDPSGLQRWAASVIEYWADLGAEGFRCDAAYQVPSAAWRALIAEARARRPGLVFAAETLGCVPQETLDTARAGFDYVFNSAKWWDFESPWLMEQYQLTREICGSIAFPESHDTPRLAEEGHGHEPLLKQRYLFTALFSSGVLMPAGFEFGFRKRLHVVHTRPSDWESPSLDLSDFIRRVNSVKS
ncbi:MAG: alpha-amylase, partial [Kiritimatiellae bacterium]|nr:alpha-amylase [Kiritimatiellia bacterium]